MINFMELQAVIWDMDGVILDSEPVHYQAKCKAFEKFGITLNEERIHNSYGMTDRQVIQFITDEHLAEDKLDKVCREKEIIFKQLISNRAEFLPGVQNWMDLFKQNGILQALASSSVEEIIQLVLAKLDAGSYFDIIIGGDTQPSKPNPSIFLKAAEKLSVIPLNCLVIEDAVTGVQAAKAAGMKCIAVTTNVPAEKLADADLVVDNLAQLMTNQVQNLFLN